MTMEKEDLGNGFSLVFQQGPSGYRAVVKDAEGAIVSRGPVVPEARIAHSKFMAVSEWMEKHFPDTPEPGIDDVDPDVEADEEDLDEDDEDDEDEELL